MNRRGVLGLLAPRAAGPARSVIPNVWVTTHEGRRARFYDDLVKNRIVLINFMYAECTGICPGMTANLQRVARKLGGRMGRDVFFYSVSLKQDPPEALQHYVEMHGIGGGWMFLTAAKADTEVLRAALGFKDLDPVLDSDISQHTGIVRFGNDALDRWGACPALAEADRIAAAIAWVS